MILLLSGLTAHAWGTNTTLEPMEKQTYMAPVILIYNLDFDKPCCLELSKVALLGRKGLSTKKF